MTKKSAPPQLAILTFATRVEFAAWLGKEHAKTPGVWLRLAKKAADEKTVSYAEALDVALCWGWIDGHKKPLDDVAWLQKFTPRGPRSIWSKINCGKAEALIASSAMRPPGLAAIALAKNDGRWDAAYASQSRATVPDDLQHALDADAKAKAFFATLSSANRYAVLFRVATVKRAETRAKRIAQFVTMLAEERTFHPQKVKPSA